MMNFKGRKFFNKINKITIFVTLLLVFVGGLVRSTGSGMGCPDWPKCFGRYIPPTNESQLPPNYAQTFTENRIKKNEKFAQFLEKVGQYDLAKLIRSDTSILEHEPFNVTKTWIEYVNRLLGAITGLLLLMTAISSFAYWSKFKSVTLLSILNLFVVGYQGWLGSIVVSTNLLQWIVTVHMLLALVLLTILIYNHHKVTTSAVPKILVKSSKTLPMLIAIFAILLTIVQIILGTDVREQLDQIAKSLHDMERNTWVSRLNFVFNYHRDLAILVLLLNAFLLYMIRNHFTSIKRISYWAYTLLLVILLQIAFGMILSYLSLPAAVQPLHLLLSMVLFCVQFHLILNLKATKRLL